MRRIENIELKPDDLTDDMVRKESWSRPDGDPLLADCYLILGITYSLIPGRIAIARRNVCDAINARNAAARRRRRKRLKWALVVCASALIVLAGVVVASHRNTSCHVLERSERPPNCIGLHSRCQFSAACQPMLDEVESREQARTFDILTARIRSGKSVTDWPTDGR